MNDRRGADSLYAATLLAFLVGLVVLGLLGVPALVVAAIGVAVAALGIALFHRELEGGGSTELSSRRRQDVPQKYVPRVLQNGSMRRRRRVHLRRHRHASPPLRFR